MPPPPASSAVSRLFLGPALRTQSDRRLVSLVRDGYENAFEEIVRRYGKPLDRFAAAIVPSHRAEDVTQDAFSKALLALRHTDKEIELRPWLYRIVRNTALNDLRDQPPATELLDEGIDGVEGPAEASQRREEIAELRQRLQALPEPQRAAIVMRELEGLSHEEIAAALGLTGGAARQTIYRARRALRDGFGMLIPIPVLHFLLASTLGGAAAGAGVGGATGAGAASAGGAGVGMKAGAAGLLVVGSVATGVAIKERSGDRDASPGTVAREVSGSSGPQPALGVAGAIEDSSGSSDGADNSGAGSGADRHGEDEREGPNGSGHGGPGPGPNSGPGNAESESEADDDDDDDDHSGSGSSGSGGSGSGGSGSGGHSGSGSGGSDSGDSDDDSESSGSGSGSEDSDDEPDDD